jgi:hypothetical protein
VRKFNLRELLDEFVLEQAAQDIVKSVPRKSLFHRLGFRQPGLLSSALWAKFRQISLIND